jgi:hypothetical protein
LVPEVERDAQEMAEEISETLQRIDRNLAALLAITVDRHIRETDLAKPRPRSIDQMLSDVGISNTEIAKLLGKSPQAVSQVLSKKASKKNGRPGGSKEKESNGGE